MDGFRLVQVCTSVFLCNPGPCWMTSGSFSWCLRKVPRKQLRFLCQFVTAGATTAAGAAAARQTRAEAPPALRELSFDVYKHFFYLGVSLSSHLSPSPFLFHSLFCAGSAFGNILPCIAPFILLPTELYKLLKCQGATGEVGHNCRYRQWGCGISWKKCSQPHPDGHRSSQNSWIHSSQWNLQYKNAQTDFAPVLLT